MTFQRAPPEVNGFGVRTWMPLRVRSPQPRMCFGLPLRTSRDTTERATMPFHLFLFHLLETSPAFTSVLTSGASESATTSAGCPAATARAWSPEAPYDWENETSLPAAVF